MDQFDPNILVLNATNRLWERHGSDPTNPFDPCGTDEQKASALHRVASDMVARNQHHSCGCPSSLQNDIGRTTDLFMACLCMSGGKLLTHYHTDSMHAFERMAGIWPVSLNQLSAYASNAAEFDVDPEAFWQKTKKTMPTEHLGRLEEHLQMASSASVFQNCGICQEETCKDQWVFTLPACGHVFHSREADCLGTDTVMSWLKANNTCPNCKAPIEL